MPDVAIPEELTTDIEEVLERVGCQFFACDGPTLQPRHMATCFRCSRCSRCSTLARLRKVCGRPVRTPDEQAYWAQAKRDRRRYA